MAVDAANVVQPDPAPAPAPSRAWLAGLVVALIVTAALYWPLPAHVTTHRALTAFNDSHGWVFDHIARMLEGERPLVARTYFAGYPGNSPSPFLGWVPALLAWPLQEILGPLGAYNVVFLATPLLTYAAAYVFLRAVTGARPALVAAGALIYTFSPFALATHANGQIEKAQLWVYPLHLWFLHGAIRGPRRWAFLPAVLVVSVAAVFTDPYFGLILPIVATPLALAWAWTTPGRVRALVSAVAALSLTAAGFASAWPYYEANLQKTGRQVFSPARASNMKETRIYAEQSPIAQPSDTLFGRRRVRTGLDEPNHTTYLVLPVLLVGAAGVALGGRRRWVAAWLLGAGITIAAGPQLVLANTYQEWRGHPYYLPLQLVVATGFPIAKGGQYYRAIAVASLGLGALVALVLGRLRAPRGEVAACGLVAVALFEGVRTTGPHWPRPTEAVVEIPQAAAMGRDPGEGAVLSLPLTASPARAGELLLLAAYHGRPTQTLAQYLYPRLAKMQHPWLERWEKAAADGGDAPRRLLRELGFRYVFVAAGTGDVDKGFRLSPAELATLLGPPDQDGPALVWDLGPTPLRPER